MHNPQIIGTHKISISKHWSTLSNDETKVMGLFNETFKSDFEIQNSQE
jgi:hypothetical protein